jgi:signal transduction histidine kinase
MQAPFFDDDFQRWRGFYGDPLRYHSAETRLQNGRQTNKGQCAEAPPGVVRLLLSMTANAVRAIDRAMLSSAPSVPVIAEVALGLRALPADAGSLSSLLSLDPVFVLRMLRASEALDRPPGESAARRIDAVLDAGGRALMQSALLDTQHWSGRFPGVPDGFRRYWTHSLLTAETARELSLRGGKSDPEEAFIAGLLLDVALPLLSRSVEYAPLLAQGNVESLVTMQERSAFGISHTEAGAALLPGAWAGDLADALRFHHSDAALFDDAPELLRVVRAAEELSGGGSGDAMQHAALAHALTGLPMEQLNDAWQTACRSTDARLAMLGLGGQGAPSLAGELYRPYFEPVPAIDAQQPALGNLARAGLLAQVLAPTPDTDVWRAYRLAAALLLDLPPPKILLRVSGDMHFATADGAVGRAIERFDLSRGDLEGMRSQLSQGSLWYCDSEQEAALLPVSLQRLMRLSHGDACVIVPMISDGTLEALALHRLSSALLPGLRARAGELDMLAIAAARASHLQRTHDRDLSDLRRSMADHYSAHAKQLRADLHTPLGLLKHQVKSMRLKMGADSMLESELAVFNDQVIRIDTVLQQFESRPPDMVAAAQWTDINQLIEQIVAESDVRTFRSRAITTELHLDSALPPLHLPLAVMRDIMSALLSVSAEQCGSTGRIAVSSADGVNWNGGLFAEIRVRDFGRGMDAARVAALFGQPSMEGEARNTLAHALEQAIALGGSLSCKSAVGQGTVLQLLLPRQTRRTGAGASGGSPA